jgi:hypothetical protein
MQHVKRNQRTFFAFHTAIKFERKPSATRFILVCTTRTACFGLGGDCFTPR